MNTEVPDVSHMSLDQIFQENPTLANEVKKLLAVTKKRDMSSMAVCGFANYIDTDDSGSSGME